MDDWDIQELNPQQSSGYTLPHISSVTFASTPNTAPLRDGVTTLQISSSQQSCLPPPTPGQLLQITHHGVLGTLYPHQEASWPVSAPGPQITETHSSNFRDGLGEFTEDQVHVYSSTPDWSDTDRGISLQPTGRHPFGEANLAFASEGDARKLEYIPGNHPTSLVQHNLGFSGTRLVPKTKRARAKGPNRVKKAPIEWLCRHGDCNKKYLRRQELIRHRRDRHEAPRKCPFCDRKWTRAERIRAHLTAHHKDYLAEEELRKLKDLQGLPDTIRFLKKYGNTT